MQPVSIKSSLPTTTSERLSSPLATMGTLWVLPLGLNSSLEAVEINTCNQLARLQYIIVQAADNEGENPYQNTPHESKKRIK